MSDLERRYRALIEAGKEMRRLQTAYLHTCVLDRRDKQAEFAASQRAYESEACFDALLSGEPTTEPSRDELLELLAICYHATSPDIVFNEDILARINKALGADTVRTVRREELTTEET